MLACSSDGYGVFFMFICAPALFVPLTIAAWFGTWFGIDWITKTIQTHKQQQRHPQHVGNDDVHAHVAAQQRDAVRESVRP